MSETTTPEDSIQNDITCDSPTQCDVSNTTEHVLQYSTGLQDHTAEYSETEPGEFYFESDHPALKGNADYQRLLRALIQRIVLRTTLIQDINKIEEVRKQALINPISFVEKLQKGEDIGFPPQRYLPPMPEVDWDKYNINADPKDLGRHQHFTRKRIAQAEQENNNTRSSSTDSDSAATQPLLVRGRIYNEGKPPSFNQLWSIEEQRKLEELLVQYPPEAIEARRWQKIAKELGTRTPQQVASRMQKYFAKLAKAGLPVPGRTPSIQNYGRKPHHHQRLNRYYRPPSTFFSSFDFSSYLSDDDDDDQNFVSGPIDLDSNSAQEEEISEEEEFESLKNSDEYKQLMMLKRLKKIKEKQQNIGVAQHIGYKCTRCLCEPIIGIRWHCIECLTEDGIDFCEDCVDCMHETQTHVSSHQLKPIYQSQLLGFVDRDYLQFNHTDYNYLDPNYMPAV